MSGMSWVSGLVSRYEWGEWVKLVSSSQGGNDGRSEKGRE